MFNKKRPAPELEWHEKRRWINSQPLTLEKLKGKVVLLDFWAYSCINCLRTLPSLKEIWEKYQNNRFVLIGIHTPEFSFEKEIGNVKYAVKKHDITWPILQDPERANWDNYGNQYWPRTALIDSEGKIVFEHVGEFGYDEIDAKIKEELLKLRENVSDEIIKESKNIPGAYLSRETYAGSARNAGIGSTKVCTKEGCDEYYDPGKYKPGAIYLQGDWAQEPEFSEYKSGNGWIAYNYYASEVNIVLSGVGEAEVLLFDKPITRDKAGKDITFSNGKSIVKVEGADLYNLIKSTTPNSGILKIKPFEEMRVYAYTFG